MAPRLQRAEWTLILLWCGINSSIFLSWISQSSGEGRKNTVPARDEWIKHRGLGSGSNWGAHWKKLRSFIGTRVSSKFYTLKLSWKSFEDQLWYPCSRNKTKRIKQRKIGRDGPVFSTPWECDLRSLEESVILSSLARPVLHLLLISDFLIKVTAGI